MLRPLILVMPSGTPDPPADTAWVDGVGPAAAWETFVARDVVRWTDSCFNTDPRPAARGIAGLSDGAYGAVNVALHHPGEFHAARVANAFSVFEGSHLPSFYRAHLPLALQIASGRLTATPRTTGNARDRKLLPPSCAPSLQR